MTAFQCWLLSQGLAATWCSAVASADVYAAHTRQIMAGIVRTWATQTPRRQRFTVITRKDHHHAAR